MKKITFRQCVCGVIGGIAIYLVYLLGVADGRDLVINEVNRIIETNSEKQSE